MEAGLNASGPTNDVAAAYPSQSPTLLPPTTPWDRALFEKFCKGLPGDSVVAFKSDGGQTLSLEFKDGRCVAVRLDDDKFKPAKKVNDDILQEFPHAAWFQHRDGTSQAKSFVLFSSIVGLELHVAVIRDFYDGNFLSDCKSEHLIFRTQ